MENINIGILDYCILAIYVCLMLGVGFYFKASAKMADYAVADKKLGLSVLIGTFLATGIGGFNRFDGKWLCCGHHGTSKTNCPIWNQYLSWAVYGRQNEKDRWFYCTTNAGESIRKKLSGYWWNFLYYFPNGKRYCRAVCCIGYLL